MNNTQNQGFYPIKYVLIMKLELETGYHIGSGDDSPVSDAGIIRDANDNLILPASSLIGRLRHELSHIFSSDKINDLFGPNQESKKSHASRIQLWDSVIELNPVSVRDCVAIDRSTRTAAHEAKFDMEVADKGLVFPIRLEIQTSQEKEETDKQIIAWIQELLLKGWFPLGGRASRGLGYFHVQDCSIYRFDLTKYNHLLNWLIDPNQLEENQKVNQFSLSNSETLRTCLRITLNLRFPDGILIAEEGSIGQSDLTPLRIRNFSDQKDYYLIPGSSLRGVLRQKCEDILKLKGEDVCDPSACGGYCLPNNSGPCPVCEFFGNAIRAGRFFVFDAVSSNSCKDSTTALFDHVAIDRFTGGAYGTSKFDEEVLWNAQFKIVIQIYDPRLSELQWLYFLFKDLQDGYLWFGYGTHKGFGRAVLDDNSESNYIEIFTTRPLSKKDHLANLLNLPEGRTASFKFNELSEIINWNEFCKEKSNEHASLDDK